MAGDEQDREDLLAEATALVERVEFVVPGAGEPIVVGFRGNGGVSFFFGADPVYQFNAGGQLRRAYVAGKLFKVVGRRLAALRRERSPTEVALLRTDLDEAETADFLRRMAEKLHALQETLSAGEHRQTGCWPPQEDVAGRVRQWLMRHGRAIELADSPHAV